MNVKIKMLRREMPPVLEEAAKQVGLEPEPVVESDGIRRYRMAGARRRQGADIVLKKTLDDIFSEAAAVSGHEIDEVIVELAALARRANIARSSVYRLLLSEKMPYTLTKYQGETCIRRKKQDPN